jgi:hypothetical protein
MKVSRLDLELGGAAVLLLLVTCLVATGWNARQAARMRAALSAQKQNFCHQALLRPEGRRME